MHAQRLHDAFRQEVFDIVEPYLWSDAEVIDYIDSAQEHFCQLTGGISDITSVAAHTNSVAGQPFVPLHPRILMIRKATGRMDYRDIRLVNAEHMMQANIRLDGTLGCPVFMVLGLERDLARLYPIPQHDEVIDLLIYRLPLQPVTSLADDLEIEPQHHRHLLHWMKWLAYNKQDSETFDRTKAEMHKALFEEYCVRAKAERERTKHVYRTVQYGGY